MDEQGYLQLDDRVTDYWGLKAGCLIRHHLIPRRGRMHIDQLPKDCPVAVEQLTSSRSHSCISMMARAASTPMMVL